MSGLTSLSSQQSSAELAQAQQFVADTFDLSAGYYSDSLCAFCHQGADVVSPEDAIIICLFTFILC